MFTSRSYIYCFEKLFFPSNPIFGVLNLTQTPQLIICVVLFCYTWSITKTKTECKTSFKKQKKKKPILFFNLIWFCTQTLCSSTSAIPMAIRPVSKLRRTESLGASSMATLKSESDTTDDDYTIEGGNNFSELDYKVIK